MFVMKELVTQKGKCTENEKVCGIFNSDQKIFAVKMDKIWQKCISKVDKGKQDKREEHHSK